jgi:hypothetical protein
MGRALNVKTVDNGSVAGEKSILTTSIEVMRRVDKPCYEGGIVLE